jgi:hypothetical protein
MKKTLVSLVVAFWLSGGAFAATESSTPPRPFGFAVGKSGYEQVQQQLAEKGWAYQEYEKKGLHEINKDDPVRGKGTFLKIKTKGLEDVRSLLLFFSPERVLDAVIVVLEPKAFDVVMDELDRKYDLVKKKLDGESFTEDCPHVLWQKGPLYIELQRYSPHIVRLVYVEKLLYENYRNFLLKVYEPFRKKEQRHPWMDDL